MAKALTIVATVLLLGMAVQDSKGDDFAEMAMALHNQCKDDSGAAEEIIERAKKGDFADDEHLGCYMKCILVTAGAMENDGTFDAETLLGTLPPDVVSKIKPAVTACKDVADPNPCKKALKMHQCFFQQDPANFFLV